jgi:hypothetical protein
VWQALLQDVQGAPFAVIAVAMDSRPDAARPWIEKAAPTYPCLIDREHHVADLYNMVNVPQAVWIDEAGRIVRPPEPAGAFEGFRSRDPVTGMMPEPIAATTAAAKRTYVEAVQDWARRGAESPHALHPTSARAHVAVPTEEHARAHAAFRLGQHLIRAGNAAEGDRFLALASQLHPESWNMWRQRAGLDQRGLAALPDFWERVKALGSKRYYAPVDLPGMPK